VDTTFLAGILDGITAREVQGEVSVLNVPVQRTATLGVPAVKVASISIEELAARETTIRGIGFRVDSVASTGACPGHWTAADKTSVCPSSARTTVALSLPWPLVGDALDRATQHSRLSGRPPEQGVAVYFLFAGPGGSGMVVSEYYAARIPDGRWVVVGKRVTFQTE
jgi:hypothetical protein